MSDTPSFSRKKFVIAGAGIAAAAVVREPAAEAHGGEVAAAPKPAHAAPKPAAKRAPLPPLASRPEAYSYFTAPESAFMEAAVERLIPTDAHGPGGREAGCAYFIDQQLVGRYGRGDTMYTHGPWSATPLPTQGYQSRLTPAEVYRLGIAATNAHVHEQHGKAFEQLSGAQQDAVLTALENGDVAFADVPAKVFFGMLLGDTIQGFFADPMYGGNRDKVGWKAIGFPGVGAVYINTVENFNKPYVVAPVGIADEKSDASAMHGAMVVPHQQTRAIAHMNAARGKERA